MQHFASKKSRKNPLPYHIEADYWRLSEWKTSLTWKLVQNVLKLTPWVTFRSLTPAVREKSSLLKSENRHNDNHPFLTTLERELMLTSLNFGVNSSLVLQKWNCRNIKLLSNLLTKLLKRSGFLSMANHYVDTSNKTWHAFNRKLDSNQ